MTGCFQSVNQVYNVMGEYDFATMELVQFDQPEIGDPIAIIDTTMGEIRVVLYPEYAPNTVKRFTEKVESGYYNGLDIAGIMDDMYFLSGYVKGEDGKYIARDTDDDLIENECVVNLWPFKGAMLTFSEKQGLSDFRWFICNEEPVKQSDINQLKSDAQSSEKYDDAARANLIYLFDKFYEIGGVFGAGGSYTVFGQTYYGYDVIADICAVPTDDDGIPKQEIKVNSITISTYGEKDAELYEALDDHKNSAQVESTAEAESQPAAE